jgi:hypothetical protein
MEPLTAFCVSKQRRGDTQRVHAGRDGAEQEDQRVTSVGDSKRNNVEKTKSHQTQ